MVPNSALGLLKDSDFLRLWLTGAVTATLRWVEVLAIGVYALELTNSPFVVAMMLFARTLPGVLLGVLTGTIASRYDRKNLLIVGLSLLTLNAIILALLGFFGRLNLWHVAVGALVSGVVWTLEHPVRRTLLGDVAGFDRLKNAMSLDQVTFNLTRVVGPLLGGGIYLILGLVGIYAVASLFYLAVTILILGAATNPMSKGARDERFREGLIHGFRYVIARPVLRSVLIITIIENFFGFSYATMVPVIGRQALNLDPAGIGLLQSMEGIGATAGALVLAISSVKYSYGRLFSAGAALFLVGVLIFAVTNQFILASIGLLIAGPGLAAFGAMQSTILLRDSDPEQRSRVMGVLVMCIGAGPLGVVCVGLLAQFVGPTAALVTMSVMGLILLSVTCFLSPALLGKDNR